MQNLSRFVTKFEKIMENESLQNISAAQYTFMSHRPLKTSFNHNIHWYKGPEIKIHTKKGPKRTKKCQICHYLS